jgi:exodeoxyribonuclease III
MKIINWNINGLKSFYKQEKKMIYMIGMINTHNPDIIFFQETKLSDTDIKNLPSMMKTFQDFGYICIINNSYKRGYAGVAALCKPHIFGLDTDYKTILEQFENKIIFREKFDDNRKTVFKIIGSKNGKVYDYLISNTESSIITSVINKISMDWNGIDSYNYAEINEGDESGRLRICGRTITIETPKYYILSNYVQNSGSVLAMLKYREEWDKNIHKYINYLETDSSNPNPKPVIWCGDLNVVREVIDITDMQRHINKSAGCMDSERFQFENILVGRKDAFRVINGNKIKYSWWSNFNNARTNNRGWRLDYFIIPEKCTEDIHKCDILDDIMGSDHAPIVIEIN